MVVRAARHLFANHLPEPAIVYQAFFQLQLANWNSDRERALQKSGRICLH